MSGVQALLFDAGDTLMRVFPYPGRMMDWPELAAVDGAAEALLRLRGRYRLAVLTNAQESTAGDIRAALRRVGLDSYFSTIITSRDIGVLKPDPAFFLAGLRALDVAADDAVMIGDWYEADVRGAKRAGLHAIWYNPQQAACPEPEPAHDAEIADLRDLPAVLAEPFLPDVGTCLAWLAEQGATGDLVPHVRRVAAVAFRLAEWLRAAGEPVDPLLAHRGGLLHDLAKASARDSGASHERAAGQLLRARGAQAGGLEALARIAERHPMWAPLTPGQAPRTWEEKLVYYADRIAEPSGVVNIDERMAQMLRRRPGLKDDLPAYAAAAHAQEAEIAARLELTGEALVARLRSECQYDGQKT